MKRLHVFLLSLLLASHAAWGSCVSAGPNAAMWPKSCVTVASSSITPTTYATPKFWIDPATAITSGGKVTQYTNLGSVAGVSNQGVSTAQPVYTAADSHLNGNPSISCDGVAQYLDFGTNQILAQAQSYTIFWIAYFPADLNPQNWPSFFSIASDGSDSVSWGAQSTSGWDDIFWGTKFTWDVQRLKFQDQGDWGNLPKKMLLEFTYDGTDVHTNTHFAGWANKVLEPTQISPGHFNSQPTNRTVFCGNAIDGSATITGFGKFTTGEFVIYSPALSSSQQASERTGYFAPKFNF